jgi:hypothetical protein
MTLTDAQKATLAQWLEDDHSLSQIQTKLKEEWQISMTFMEVRFLIDDLNLELKKPEVVEEDSNDSSESAEPELSPEGVSLEVDSIVTPGAIVSGSVTFTDGTDAKWQIDQMGRLGLTGVDAGYQPPESDIQEFQMLLQTELKKKGMA